MQSFTDAKGRDWPLAFTTEDQMRVAEATGHRVCNMFQDGQKLFYEIFQDAGLAATLYFWSVKELADERGVDLTEFRRSIYGDQVEPMTLALVEATIDFFPKGDRRETLRKYVRTQVEAAAIAATRADEMMGGISPEEIAETLIESCSSLPGSSESTPDPSITGS